MRAVFSALFWAYLALICVPLFLGAVLVWLLTLPVHSERTDSSPVLVLLGQLLFWSNPFWRLRVDGREHLPWRGGAVLVSNHASLADILVLFGLWRPFKWVSKASNFRIPLIGWNMRLNRYVRVRGDKESIAAMVHACEAWLSRGVPVLLFPEGTRSADGAVKAFKDGAFRMALDRGVPLIPIALSGTGDVLPKHGWVMRGTARCRVRVLPPVDPARFRGDFAMFRDHVRDLIVAEKGRLDQEAGARR